MRPSGLQVALHYARASRTERTLLEVEYLAFATARAWIAAVGLRGLPRTDGWPALTRWTNERMLGGGQPAARTALFTAAVPPTHPDFM